MEGEAMERDPHESPAEVVRSEEELSVGKRTVEHGRVEVTKRVETEEVELPVELEREVLAVEREPIGEHVEAHEFREQSIEIPLHAQEPVVRKDVVAKERITVGTDVETHSEPIADEVRRERVEVEVEEEPGTGG
jgi:uncharacterized protein (TIGR02271 family)